MPLIPVSDNPSVELNEAGEADMQMDMAIVKETSSQHAILQESVDSVCTKDQEKEQEQWVKEEVSNTQSVEDNLLPNHSDQIVFQGTARSTSSSESDSLPGDVIHVNEDNEVNIFCLYA